MAIFKKKKEEVKDKAPTADKVEVTEKEKNEPQSVEAGSFGSGLVLFPLLTEKSTDIQTENKYVFVVAPNANKSEIKKEIERLFNVGVESVNILKAKRKSRSWRGIRGHRSGYKKAIVTIEEGKKIEILPA